MTGPILIAMGYAFLAPAPLGRTPERTRSVVVRKGAVRLGEVSVFPYGVAVHRVETGRARHRLQALAAVAHPAPAGRRLPATRAGCPPDPDACRYVSCTHHLALDVGRGGSIQYAAPVLGYDADGLPDLNLDAMPHRCALALADRGGMDLKALGAALGVTRERARQLEEAALAKLRARVDPAALETPPDRVGAWDLADGYE